MTKSERDSFLPLVFFKGLGIFLEISIRLAGNREMCPKKKNLLRKGGCSDPIACLIHHSPEREFISVSKYRLQAFFSPRDELLYFMISDQKNSTSCSIHPCGKFINFFFAGKIDRFQILIADICFLFSPAGSCRTCSFNRHHSSCCKCK